MNEYYKYWKENNISFMEVYKKYNGNIPTDLKWSFTYREEAIKKYAWAVPSDQAIETIVKYSPIIEIGAGSGYWAKLIAEAGGDIVAYDIELGTGHWYPVLQGFPFDITKHPDRTLFLCWPPYDTSMAYNCLCHYKGDTVIYIGEGWGGCTGDDNFHELLKRDYECVDCVSLPQWDGIHDRMEIYRRQK